jgi:Cu+-exporting ATPase
MDGNEQAHPSAAEARCSRHHDHAGHAHHALQPEAARDPVCGMSVDPATSTHRSEHRSQTFHFCSAGCRTKFEADPGKYLNNTKDEMKEAEVPAGTIYTCPMHPEIRQVGPGTCPICGMALEPEVASLDIAPNPELDPARVRNACGAMGGLAVLRARLAIVDHTQSQHVHADRDGHGRRLSV